MMVLFLTGMVSIILLRTVKRDFSRYDQEEESLDDFVSSPMQKVARHLDISPLLFASSK